MTDALKKVLEEISLSESAKASIAEAWEAKLSETRDEIAGSLRDEFAAKYEKDKDEIVEAMGLMINTAIEPKVKELVEQKKMLAAEQVQFKKGSSAKMKAFESFLKESLSKELSELSADRKKTNAKVSEVGKFVQESLTKELEEFHEQRRKLVEDRVEHKIKAKKELAETKKKMVSKMAIICEKFIREHLVEEMSQLKSELLETRKKHFGLKIFESFAAEFGSTFFNDRKEMKKVLTIIENQNAELKRLKGEVAKRNERIVESENRFKILQDRTARNKQLNELCSTLAGSKRKLMVELLEKVPTHKLEENFKMYLPSVIDDKVTTRKPLSESTNARPVLKEVSGNKKPALTESKTTEGSAAISEILGKYSNMNTYIADNKNNNVI